MDHRFAYRRNFGPLNSLKLVRIFISTVRNAYSKNWSHLIINFEEKFNGPKLRRHAYAVTCQPFLWSKNHTPVTGSPVYLIDLFLINRSTQNRVAWVIEAALMRGCSIEDEFKKCRQQFKSDSFLKDCQTIPLEQFHLWLSRYYLSPLLRINLALSHLVLVA